MENQNTTLTNEQNMELIKYTEKAFWRNVVFTGITFAGLAALTVWNAAQDRKND